MSTARFDRLITQSTNGALRLADGHTISVIAAGADAVDVYLWPGLPAPDASGWEDEDPAEVFLTGGNMDGRYCCNVPVQAVRDLIEQHVGEAAAADDEVITAPLAQLRATGVRCLNRQDSAGRYVRVPLADGTEITVSGTAADRDGTRGAEVSIHHLVRDHASWQASRIDRNGRSVHVYDSYGQRRPYEEDTSGLVAAVLTQVQQCGGSAPERGVGETAEQLARAALAEQGITAHRDDDAGNTWLVIGGDQTSPDFPDMLAEPYAVLYLGSYGNDEEITVDRAPAPGDEWTVLAGDGTGAERELTTRPADQLADCVQAVTAWLATLQGTPSGTE
ncbi:MULTISPECIES: hypothetical protein [unclassified Streptomyces]|uniref:hypothetical protein n=1 Tax=unclassified Streptomyces TaxID=2593676 RepID=UPI00074772F3|nr:MULTISPECIES: hypothetical protein [unclassified Streptomyces]KUL73942.1 hypothetical protein ADL34_18950 [Streptomyces sp. NRRL WC-3605]KUL74341.1 hypothetical protein ADL33_17740 [Streptomyces sp. NRRL WC-3604]